MLRRLHIENYVLVDSLETSFPEGLVILTGQTGAGKSLLLGALSLLTGARADVSLLSDKQRNCVVEGDFDVPDGIVRFSEDGGFDVDGPVLTLRRVIAPSGRSRAFVNDCPVQLPLLQELSSILVDIHSQHQTLRLSDKAYRLEMLDRYAGNAALLESHADAYRKVRSLRAALEELEERSRRGEEEREYEASRLKRLVDAALRSGELSSLEAEEKILSNAEAIKSGLGRIEEINSPLEGEGLESGLREVEKLLSRTSAFVPSLASLAERVDSLRVELADIMDEVSSLNLSTELSESRLEAVQDRISDLHDLMRVFGVSSEEELISLRDELSSKAGESEDLSFRISALRKELKAAGTLEEDLSSKLHASRAAAAVPFAEAVTATLRSLELERGRFSVELQRDETSPSGADRAVFLFSADGNEANDASKTASGGELSRIMLSLKAVMSGYMHLPTMVFDEIDSGVSGSAADKMGSLICAMGANMQIFAITHLPQVAAKGAAHYLVTKSSASDRPVTSIRRIEGEDRVLEIARMLSGSTVTGEAVANARVLLVTN